LGVASFLIAIGFPGLLLALFAALQMVGVLKEHGYISFENETGDEVLIILTLIGGLGGPIVHRTGLVMGIVAAFQKKRRKLFAIVRMMLNCILLLSIAIGWVLFFGWLIKALAWH
jgi:hypothetical protein